MISICMLTLNRFHVTVRVLNENRKHLAGFGDVEFLIADNGSEDDRIVHWTRDFLKPAYHRVNSENEGVARSFNQLMLRAKGEYICLVGNDIRMPPRWAKTFLGWAQCVPEAGIIGMQCTQPTPPLTAYKGVGAYFLDGKIDKVFGNMFFSRSVLDKVGGFCEEFHPYGLEDSDFNNRVTMAGLKSFYIPNAKTYHVCEDSGTDSDYRRMKDESLTRGLDVLGKRLAKQKETGIFLEPLPELRDPL